MNTVGDRIRNARKSKGLSQLKLAQELGVIRQTIIDWEANKSRPQKANAENLVRVLDLPLSALNPYGAGGIGPEAERHLGIIPQID